MQFYGFNGQDQVMNPSLGDDVRVTRIYQDTKFECSR